MNVLDLYCSPGGRSEGWHRAGWRPVGVDIEHQPDYPFQMIQADALTFLDTADLSMFDAIIASPPCQSYSWAAAKHRNSGKEYPDLLEPTRQRLIAIGKPYVIENVIGAPLINPITLRGTMFRTGTKARPGVIRARLFESNIPLIAPPDQPALGSVRTGEYVTVAGHGGDGVARYDVWCDAMGIHWLQTGSITERKERLAQMIPPVYSEYIARQVKHYLDGQPMDTAHLFELHGVQLQLLTA